MNEPRKTIIFDFGNVLIDLDYEKHFSALSELFGSQWPNEGYPPAINLAIYKYDKGLISDDAFIWQFQQFNVEVNPSLIVQAWNNMISLLPMQRLLMLEKLKRNYNLVLLSNINALHLRHIHLYLTREHSLTNFEEKYFDKIFYSHLIQKRKPESEIYSYVLSQLNQSLEQILFIDDKLENVESAISQGWNAIRHNPEFDIVDNIEKYLSTFDF